MGSKGKPLVIFFGVWELLELSESKDSSPPPDRASSTGAALEAHYRFVVWRRAIPAQHRATVARHPKSPWRSGSWTTP